MALTASFRFDPAASGMLPREVPSAFRISIGQLGAWVVASAVSEVHSLLLATDWVLIRLVTVKLMAAPGVAEVDALAVTLELPVVAVRPAASAPVVRALAAAVIARIVVLTV